MYARCTINALCVNLYTPEGWLSHFFTFTFFVLSHLIHAFHSARTERSIRRTGSLIRARRCAVSA